MSSGMGLSCAGGGDQSWQHVNAQSQSQSQAVCLAFLPWFWLLLLLLRHNGLGGVGIGGSRGGSVAWWFGGSVVRWWCLELRTLVQAPLGWLGRPSP